MIVEENTFFRQATLMICGNLNFEIALQKCLEYLKAFMPADRFHLRIYDRGLGALRTIAIATETEAKRVDIVLPLDEMGRGFLDDPDLPSVMVWNRASTNPIAAHIVHLTGQPNYSAMVMHLALSGARLGNLILAADGVDRYSEDHLRLFSSLYEPFAIAVSNALRLDELNQLKNFIDEDIRDLKSKHRPFSEEDIIGQDFGLREVMRMVRKVAPIDCPVLLQGETGAGKEVIAKAIHHLSNRKNGPFIQMNCGAIPDTLIDSELFGHEKGAFTGAIFQKRGCFELASGGTIFLDEIGELPPEAQVRMLRVLQDRFIQRVGGTTPIRVDIRIIAATHQNLQEMTRKNLFRADLWFRLHVFPIAIPPLRERKEDIPALVNHFIQKKSKEMLIPKIPRLAPGAMQPLLEYLWPGNVRELENVLQRALILRNGPLLSFDHLACSPECGGERIPVAEHAAAVDLDHVVAAHIKEILKVTRGKIQGQSGAAELLGVRPSTLRYRMKSLGIPYGRGVKY